MAVPDKRMHAAIRRTAPPAGAQARLAARTRVVAAGAGAASQEVRRRWLTPAGWFFLVSTLVVYVGWRFPTERYITPETGVGYWLGIIGGSMMLLLLLYSARKRIRAFHFLGSVTRWFQVHMVLGVVGPICILYHANYTLGATNSNVALYCTVVVAVSGLVGRYIYAHIHFGLFGRKSSLSELQASAERLRSLSKSIAFLPQLVDRLELAERRLLSSGPRLPLLGLAKPLVVASNVQFAKWRLRRYVRQALRTAARRSPTLATQQRRLRKAAIAYVDMRLVTTRRVATFEAFERLFSVWHVLHLPLFFMLIIAGIVHVIAVHVY